MFFVEFKAIKYRIKMELQIILFEYNFLSCIGKLFPKLEVQGWNSKINLYSESDQEHDPKTFNIIFFRSSSGLVFKYKYHSCI